jgi:outer membrane protein OmpA-like peptidoglycan-associated protein
MRLLKYISLFIFSAVSIAESLGQDAVKPIENVRIYFQAVSYSNPQKNLPSRVVVYDTYYHKIDSITIPEEGLYLSLPKIDLLFRVSTPEIGYKSKGEVFYADELKDSIKIIIDPKGVSRCPISIRPILFQQNSYALDSIALVQLKDIKRMFLLSDDSTHRFNVQLHSKIDILEKTNDVELLTNRARVIKEVLIKNNAMNIVMFVTNNKYRPIEKPKTQEEHACNRCVDFKVGWAH